MTNESGMYIHSHVFNKVSEIIIAAIGYVKPPLGENGSISITAQVYDPLCDLGEILSYDMGTYKVTCSVVEWSADLAKLVYDGKQPWIITLKTEYIS